ncbi:cyclic nucleotide-binding domain-containing protein [bacterium]|nr:MAG: cyclic nucleotide-binding domain-containing protein [bacterium]
MKTEDLSEVLHQHPFLGGMADNHIQTLLGCASSIHVPEGAYLIHEGQIANKFFLIRTGRMTLEMDVPPRGSVRIQTVGPGEVLGWSWLISPYRWHFSACAVADVRALALDGECLRNKCMNDHDFGYEMLERLSHVMERRLEATRLQLVDFFAATPGVGQ